MSHTKAARERLCELIVEWFATPLPDYTVPILAANIIGYLTTPKEASNSPNWIILYTLHTTTREMVVGGAEQPARFGILLASRLSKGDDAEASRKAAEDWLDDAEEMLLELLPEAEDPLWQDITVLDVPQRDTEPLLGGKFRSSQLVIEMEKP